MVKKIALFVLIVALCAVPCFAVSELSNDEMVKFIQTGAPSVSVGLVGSRFYGTVYGTTQPFDFSYDSTVTSWINTNEVKTVNLDFHVGSATDVIYKANYTYLVSVSLGQYYDRSGWTYGSAVGDYITDVEGVILYSSAKIRVDVSSEPQLISVNMLIRPSVDLKWVSVPISYPDYNGGTVRLYSSNVSCIGDLSQSEFNDLTLGKLDNIQGTLNNHSERAHQDAQDIKDKLDSNGQQAHQDAQDLKNSVETLPDKEKAEAENASDGKADAVVGSMGDSFDVSSLKNSMQILYDSLTYHGTDCVWTFPASGNVPFLGKLWDEQQIDLAMFCHGKWWTICQPIVSFVMACGSVYVVMYQLRACIYEFYGGGEDEE